MQTPRISASSYSNTAPLVWSFLYGTDRGRVELILDNAPARSAQLLAEDRVDAALVPVIAAASIEGVRLIPDVCVGAKERVRSVCLVTRGRELANVRSVSLDTSSRTSVVLTKVLYREFYAAEPEWHDAAPDIDEMLAGSDAALLIGDPALMLSHSSEADLKTFDLAELWKQHTGFGFIFAMWMTRRESVAIDFAAARDEGVAHIDDIAANYAASTRLDPQELTTYLQENISYTPDDSMLDGMKLYFELAAKHRLIERPPGLTAGAA